MILLGLKLNLESKIMFYDVVLFTGYKDQKIKTFGAYKCAHELRLAGFRTLVVNHLHEYSLDELQQIITSSVGPNTLFVGFSNTFLQLELKVFNPLRPSKSVIQYFLPHGPEIEGKLVEHIRLINPNCKIVVGGTRTFFNFNNSYVDYAVIGYADISVVNLAKHLRDRSELLKCRRNLSGIMIINDPVAEGFDFVNSSMTWTKDDIVIPGEILPLEISRGCVFSCSFCNYRLNGKKNLDYLKQYDILRQELIENYERYNITYYRLLDDTYNDTKQKIDIMLDMVRSLPFRPRFWSYLRLDLLAKHPETIDKIIETGIVSFFFGIETLNQRTGRIIGKGYDPEAQVETIREMKRHYGDKIWLHGSFICGLPGETQDSIQHTMKRLLTKDIPLDSCYYNPLTIQKNEFETWQSAFGLDMSKFGYTGLPWVQDDHTIQEVNWKNDIMDLTQAKQLCAWFRIQWLKCYQSNRKLDPAESPVNQSDTYLGDYKKKLFDHLRLNQTMPTLAS